jgi:hypothetical protein
MSLLRSLACSLLYLSIAAPLTAEWKRMVQGKDYSHDISSAHPLAYFTRNPFLRDDSSSLCADCRTAEGKANSAFSYKANVKMRQVGVISGLPVLEVDYAFTDRQDDSFIERWISILVKTGPHAYNEIYHLQAEGAIALPIEPARIVHVPGGDILMIMNLDGGNGGGCYEGYWRITGSGNTQIDFSPLRKEVEAHIPAGTRYIPSCWALDLDHHMLRSGVQKINAECHACDWVGEITAHFRLEGNLVEATDVAFEPDRN